MTTRVPAIPPCDPLLFRTGFCSTSPKFLVVADDSCAVAICYAQKALQEIPDEMGVEELFVGGRDQSRMAADWSKSNGFLAELSFCARPDDAYV